MPAQTVLTLQPPSSEETVQKSGPEGTVYLWRGTRPETATRIKSCMTAGGYDISATPGLQPLAPSEEQAIAQVVGASGQKFQSSQRLPEFTTSQHWARVYATGAIICIGIRRKFLTKGSGTEDGWIALPEAPLEEANWVNFTSQKNLPTLTGKDGRRLLAD